MSDSSESSDATPPRKPLLRNPFFWGAIAGLIFVPAIRPFLRRVPDPPPVSGQVHEFELVDQHGASFRSSRLGDRVYLATLIDPHCGAACEARVAHLVKLQQRLRTMAVPLWLLSLPADPGRDGAAQVSEFIEQHGGDLREPPQRSNDRNTESSNHWAVTSGSLAAITPVLQALAPSQQRRIALVPDTALADWAVLVDGEGGVRGAYRVDDDGLDEVFHRAQHVMSLRRQWRRQWR